MDAVAARRPLHGKRSFNSRHTMLHAHAHPRTPLDSPAAYDASEEDNDPLTDDAASASSVPAPAARLLAANANASSRQASARRPPPGRTALAVALMSDDDAGTDSPTYDGDIESSTTAAAPGPRVPIASTYSSNYDSSASTRAASPASTLTSPASPAAPLPPTGSDPAPSDPHLATELSEPLPAPIAAAAFDPAKLTPADIQAYVRAAIAAEGQDARQRKYKVNPPPAGRPARIYADGVYDLFHFGHALQLRQAKLSFPPPAFAGSASEDTPACAASGVHLLVGVNSDQQCTEHKNRPVMNHAERCEAVRHCRWVDEVVPDAPWVIDEAFLQKHQIDYVAHDEDPYVSGGLDDVYGYCKSQGKFIPTRRTPGVSTSELLERIVSQYRLRAFDKKLARMGHAELMAEGSDYDDSAPGSVRVSRAGSPGPR